ncbi:flagellar biosynthetic protein FliO [Magnetospira sp. QH-2]|uniref:flagellar biosynthetic protein FliO n=1 Tax=Magnetospira sp. (strain QH-2) TaxID=1288970 RepID=UPI0003E80B83|nr:flagellar biosynthetic protein FliO [Magnetospira sp. QH-2]CCQ74112.1 Conserved protein of unknown function [Magnetospira sp. QH-2]
MNIEEYIQFGAALVFVLGLIGLLALIARKFGMGNKVPSRGAGRRKRLSLVEVMPLDARRRLVLIRRDDRDHLILLGPANGTDLLIERNIPVQGMSSPPKPAEDANKPLPIGARKEPSL